MKIPYGFAVDNGGKFTVDKTQAQIIQMVYREYLSGNSLGGLARILESRGIPSPWIFHSVTAFASCVPCRATFS